MYRSRSSVRRRAAVAVQVIVMLPVLVGFAVITVDVGIMYNAKSDMQRTADAAAVAAATDYANALADDGEPVANAIAAAIDLVSRNPVLSQTLSLNPGTDVVFGRAYYDDVENEYNFVVGDPGTNAVRVTVRHTADSPNGSLPLYFASIFGRSSTDLSTSAVALFVNNCYTSGDCYDVPTASETVMCMHGDPDDSDDSQAGTSDDSDDSNSDDSDDGGDSRDSEGWDSSADSDAGETIIVDTTAVPLFLAKGATEGACASCPVGDSDDSDDSQGEFGPPDSSDSDDSDSGDSDGSENGDSDDSDDSQGEFGPPDSDDSDDSDSGDSDGSDSGDSDDSDDSQGEFGPPDSDDSDDSEASDGKTTICHLPPGNPGNPQTITVGTPSVPAHLAHGDRVGACSPPNPGPKCTGSLKVFLIQ